MRDNVDKGHQEDWVSECFVKFSCYAVAVVLRERAILDAKGNTRALIYGIFFIKKTHGKICSSRRGS